MGQAPFAWGRAHASFYDGILTPLSYLPIPATIGTQKSPVGAGLQPDQVTQPPSPNIPYCNPPASPAGSTALKRDEPGNQVFSNF
jgi:hypothetical protein